VPLGRQSVKLFFSSCKVGLCNHKWGAGFHDFFPAG
jgi:hypothetical protein